MSFRKVVLQIPIEEQKGFWDGVLRDVWHFYMLMIDAYQVMEKWPALYPDATVVVGYDDGGLHKVIHVGW